MYCKCNCICKDNGANPVLKPEEFICVLATTILCFYFDNLTLPIPIIEIEQTQKKSVIVSYTLCLTLTPLEIRWKTSTNNSSSELTSKRF